jgi:hypothetical protein
MPNHSATIAYVQADADTSWETIWIDLGGEG